MVLQLEYFGLLDFFFPFRLKFAPLMTLFMKPLKSSRLLASKIIMQSSWKVSILFFSLHKMLICFLMYFVSYTDCVLNFALDNYITLEHSFISIKFSLSLQLTPRHWRLLLTSNLRSCPSTTSRGNSLTPLRGTSSTATSTLTRMDASLIQLSSCIICFRLFSFLFFIYAV